MENYEKMAGQNGTVTIGELTVAMTQSAYCDNYGTDGDVRYYATAIDSNGHTYKVTWDTVEGWSDHVCGEDGNCVVEDCDGLCKDEANACDWDSPVPHTRGDRGKNVKKTNCPQ